VRAAANEISTVYTTTNVSEFTDVVGEKTVAGYEVASDGYIKAFDLGETAEIIPSAVGGSATTYICDYHYCNASSTALRTLLVGGSCWWAAMRVSAISILAMASALPLPLSGSEL
jgi:hypothetical protein